METTRELLGTGVLTSAVGFGCAGLFRIPRREARRWILDSAYDAGIRHFDVAPMYGLGSAEAELASFLKSRRDNVTITTNSGSIRRPLREESLTSSSRCAQSSRNALTSGRD